MDFDFWCPIFIAVGVATIILGIVGQSALSEYYTHVERMAQIKCNINRGTPQ